MALDVEKGQFPTTCTLIPMYVEELVMFRAYEKHIFIKHIICKKNGSKKMDLNMGPKMDSSRREGDIETHSYLRDPLLSNLLVNCECSRGRDS